MAKQRKRYATGAHKASYWEFLASGALIPNMVTHSTGRTVSKRQLTKRMSITEQDNIYSTNSD